MSLDNFDALVKLLGDEVGTNVAMSNIRCDEAIYPEMTVAIGIRVLAGGSYDDIMNTYGISKTGFYTARNTFLNAVLNCGELDIDLPTEASEWEKIRKGFASKSYNQVLAGCVGAINGFFQPTKCPTLTMANCMIKPLSTSTPKGHILVSLSVFSLQSKSWSYIPLHLNFILPPCSFIRATVVDMASSLKNSGIPVPKETMITQPISCPHITSSTNTSTGNLEAPCLILLV
jgi:hypothetical protein